METLTTDQQVRCQVLSVIARLAVPACAVLFPSGLLQGQSTVAQQTNQAIDLRVISYNVHLLPKIAERFAGVRGNSKYRAGEIAGQLAGYDLIGLCETFNKRRRNELICKFTATNTKFHIVHSPKPTGRAFTSGGLLLASRYPIVTSHVLTYQHASRFRTYGFRADGFSAKGVIHARIRLQESPELLIDCFLTHLESISSSARAKQIETLGNFMAQHSSPRRPAILMGDLNVKADFPLREKDAANASEYQQLLAVFAQKRLSLLDVWPLLQSSRGGTSDALAQNGGDRIDYLFVSKPADRTSARIHPKRVRTLRFLDDKVPEGSLSDHAAVECTLRYIPPTPAGTR